MTDINVQFFDHPLHPFHTLAVACAVDEQGNRYAACTLIPDRFPRDASSPLYDRSRARWEDTEKTARVALRLVIAMPDDLGRKFFGAQHDGFRIVGEAEPVRIMWHDVLRVMAGTVESIP